MGIVAARLMRGDAAAGGRKAYALHELLSYFAVTVCQMSLFLLGRIPAALHAHSYKNPLFLCGNPAASAGVLRSAVRVNSLCMMFTSGRIGSFMTAYLSVSFELLSYSSGAALLV